MVTVTYCGGQLERIGLNNLMPSGKYMNYPFQYTRSLRFTHSAYLWVSYNSQIENLKISRNNINESFFVTKQVATETVCIIQII
jgi:hypothetical protein